MKKTLCRAVCLCLFSSINLAVSAQNKLKIAVDGGYTYTAMNANLSNLVNSRYTTRYGFGINLSGEYLIWKSLFISTGISYLQKNYQFERTGRHSGWFTKYNNDFLGFPLLVGGYILNNPNKSQGVWIKLAGGMYTEYWLKMKREGQYPVIGELQENGNFNYIQVSDTYDFEKNENQLNRFGYGLQGQAQLGYSFNKFDLHAAYNYQYGLSDINKAPTDKDQKMTTRSYMISLGVAYKFN
ncbi:outer membrane beta-barrel protein [Chryseobacterium tructae]|uniref:Outer membrane beta-barrel protein n=1 Tax=Chryseobacterium tructae TaxID=1037380 RepID=A0ABV7XWC8_9FLAO|nr:outer membrane beta-barrel protein [Chryseobacterium tructae]MDN3692515.1 outer membrane beta-barrel protein [Chryseobacterium tructae]